VAIKVEGWDAIQTAIYRKEDPPRQGDWKKFRERESDHCIIEKCVPKESLLLG